MGILSRFRRCRSGTAAIEFAIVGLVFIMLCIGVIEFGRALNVRSDMARAVDVAERSILLNKDATEAAIATSLSEAFDRGDRSLLTVAAPVEVVLGKSYRRIQATYPMQLILVGAPETPIVFSIIRRVPID